MQSEKGVVFGWKEAFGDVQRKCLNLRGISIVEMKISGTDQSRQTIGTELSLCCDPLTVIL
jgi:hypothetical protein